MIFKIVRKSMNKKKGLVISIFILMILSTMLLSMTSLIYNTLADNYDQMLGDNQVEDYRMYSMYTMRDKYPDEMIEEIEDKYDLTIEKKLTTSYEEETDSNKEIYEINKYDSDAKLNQISLVDGEYPENEYEIILQPGYFTASGKKIGDSITVGDQDYKIVGEAYFTEYVMPISMTNQIVYPDFEKFAPVYLNGETFDKVLEKDQSNVVMYFSVKFNNETTKQERDDIISEIKKDYKTAIPLLDENGAPQINEEGKLKEEQIELFPISLSYELNSPISGVTTEVSASKNMFLTLSIFLMIMSGFLAVILINNVFKTQRREMGILKAEGVSIAKLSLGFIAYMAVIIVVAAGIGMFVSQYSAQILTDLYADYFQIYEYPVSTETWMVVLKNISIAVGSILILVYFVSIYKNLNQKTLLLIKNIDSERPPRVSLTRHLTFLGFKAKNQINILMRNFSKTILLAFGVFASSLLILMGVIMYTSLDKVINNTGSVNTYDYTVHAADGKSLEQTKNSILEEYVLLTDVDSDVELTENDNVQFEAFDVKNNEFVNLKNASGQKIDSTDGLIVSDSFLKKYELAIGDSIAFENPYDSDMDIEVKIVDEVKDYMMPAMYIDLDYAQELLDISDNYATSEMVAGSPDALLEKYEGSYSQEKIDIVGQMKDMMAIMNTVIVLIGTLAAVVGFIALSTISNVIIDSNRKTISIMKVMGYTENEVKATTIGFFKWIVVVVYFACIPLVEKVLKLLVAQATSEMDFDIDINIDLKFALFGFVIIFLTYVVSERVAYRRIKKVKISESLKADE